MQDASYHLWVLGDGSVWVIIHIPRKAPGSRQMEEKAVAESHRVTSREGSKWATTSTASQWGWYAEKGDEQTPLLAPVLGLEQDQEDSHCLWCPHNRTVVPKLCCWQCMSKQSLSLWVIKQGMGFSAGGRTAVKSLTQVSVAD